VNWTKGELGLDLGNKKESAFLKDLDPSCIKLGHQASPRHLVVCSM